MTWLWFVKCNSKALINRRDEIPIFCFRVPVVECLLKQTVFISRKLPLFSDDSVEPASNHIQLDIMSLGDERQKQRLCDECVWKCEYGCQSRRARSPTAHAELPEWPWMATNGLRTHCFDSEGEEQHTHLLRRSQDKTNISSQNRGWKPPTARCERTGWCASALLPVSCVTRDVKLRGDFNMWHHANKNKLYSAVESDWHSDGISLC